MCYLKYQLGLLFGIVGTEEGFYDMNKIAHVKCNDVDMFFFFFFFYLVLLHIYCIINLCIIY
jgi:hypothetical protein